MARAARPWFLERRHGRAARATFGMKRNDFDQYVVLINGAVPLAILLWDAYQKNLGVNPTTFALHTTGTLALVFLFLSLAVTPLRKLTGRNWWSLFRRSLGLYGFFYACVHLSIYFWFDRERSIAKLTQDVVKRPFILFGMTALLLMVPLAATSTNASIKKLGAKNWNRLHKLVYASAILGTVHFYMSQKRDVSKPIVFAIVLAVLLLIRVFGKWIKPIVPPKKTARKPIAQTAASSS